MACTAIFAQGGEKFLSNEHRSRLIAKRRFWTAFGVSVVLHATLLGWPGGVGPWNSLTAFPTGRPPGGRLEVRLVSQEQTERQSKESQVVVDAAQASSVVPIAVIRQFPGESMREGDKSLLSAPLAPEPIRPGFPDVHYYTKRELGKDPRLISVVSLEAKRGVSPPVGGKVSLRLWINENGRVDRVVVVRTNLPVILTESAVAAFAAARFQPGQIDDEAVKSQLAIEVSYEINAQATNLRLHEPTILRVR